MTAGDSVAGRSASPRSARARPRGRTSPAGRPASIAAGTARARAPRAPLARRRGRSPSPWCVSRPVSPSPGKCLTAAATPAACSPRTNADPGAATARRVVAERPDPDAGFAGFVGEVAGPGRRRRSRPSPAARSRSPRRRARRGPRRRPRRGPCCPRTRSRRRRAPGAGRPPGRRRPAAAGAGPDAAGRLERLGELADLPGRPDVEVAEQRHAGGRRRGQPLAPTRRGQRVAVEREHHPPEDVGGRRRSAPGRVTP